ncbi:Catechol 2,3-dioxygenase [Variovorax sp. HW608]|uniref:VOC family protein n=1 Tax=Variovorax sp. HW608 TaxID=1034889 RepID=UPI00081F840D|nr:VOC family protein [Variovorax sp. HW608]SCK15427.1 Catechol 2,3-dioxygenase [Variovorax sp. HW608]
MIAVEDIAYVRYQAPDLDLAQTFLTDFGLTTALRKDDVLYMRGVGVQSFVHVTQRGETPACLGFGLKAQNKDDLHKLAAELGARVEDNPEPGGGYRVTFADPAGYSVDVLWGSEEQRPLPARPPLSTNFGPSRGRRGRTVRLDPGPSHVLRLGHVVLRVPSFNTSYDFYARLLGFQISDSYFVGEPDHTVAAFMHAGLGKRYSDHHTIALLESPLSGFDHSAFEVLDWDDLVVGNEHLRNKQYRHSWGIGRHIHGSQVFDYWRDPFGFKVEHWTDGDLVNEDYLRSHEHFAPERLAQWSPPLPEDFLA